LACGVCTFELLDHPNIAANGDYCINTQARMGGELPLSFLVFPPITKYHILTAREERKRGNACKASLETEPFWEFLECWRFWSFGVCSHAIRRKQIVLLWVSCDLVPSALLTHSTRVGARIMKIQDIKGGYDARETIKVKMIDDEQLERYGRRPIPWVSESFYQRFIRLSFERVLGGSGMSCHGSCKQKRRKKSPFDPKRRFYKTSHTLWICRSRCIRCTRFIRSAPNDSRCQRSAKIHVKK